MGIISRLVALENANATQTTTAAEYNGATTTETAGIIGSTVIGPVALDCTLYTDLNRLQTAFKRRSIKLTGGASSSIAPVVNVKRGANRASFAAVIVSTGGTYGGAPYLDASFNWCSTVADAKYYAVARYSTTYAIAVKVAASSGGGGGVPASWTPQEKEVVTGVAFSLTAGGELQIDVTKETLKYIDSGANDGRATV